MWRYACLALVTATAVGADISAARAQTLIPQTTALRYGLTRSWFAQVGSPRASGVLDHVNYDEGMLLVQSRSGVLTAIDAETGRTLWATQVGARNRWTSEPAANDNYVVVLNGSTLFVVSRTDGHIAWQQRTSGAPGAGPGVSQTHAFVPLVSGKVEGYNLEAGARQTPWNFQSSGRVLTPPMTTELTVSWTTDRGYFYVGDPSAGGIRYRLETRDEIRSRPAAWSPALFAGSTDGYAYAVNEIKGNILWKFPVGEAIYEAPVAIENQVFVVTEFGGMYCLDAATGAPLWHVPAVRQFVAKSPTRIYVRSTSGDLSILDAATGTRLGRMPLPGNARLLANHASDRMFLVDTGCVIQCLHERAITSPLAYTPPPLEQEEVKLKVRPPRAAEPAADEAPETEAEMPADEPEENPFGTPDEPAENPFGDLEGPADNPFGTPEEGADASSPF